MLQSCAPLYAFQDLKFSFTATMLARNCVLSSHELWVCETIKTHELRLPADRRYLHMPTVRHLHFRTAVHHSAVSGVSVSINQSEQHTWRTLCQH
jgi:hypothetical protein